MIGKVEDALRELVGAVRRNMASTAKARGTSRFDTFSDATVAATCRAEEVLRAIEKDRTP